MASSLSTWKDSVGEKFNQAVTNTTNYLNNGIKPVQEKIDYAKQLVSKPVVVKSYIKEISNLEVK